MSRHILRKWGNKRMRSNLPRLTCKDVRPYQKVYWEMSTGLLRGKCDKNLPIELFKPSFSLCRQHNKLMRNHLSRGSVCRKRHQNMCQSVSYWIFCRPNNQNLCRSMPWNRETLCWPKQSAVCYPMLAPVLWKFYWLGMPFKLSWICIRIQAWSWKALCCWMSFTLLCLWINSFMCY